MKNRIEYEEFSLISTLWSWVILTVFAALILGWGMFAEMMVKEQPSHWDFGQLPDTPGQSIYSISAVPSEANIPDQVQRIPDALPLPGELQK
jgi:hypothetical protein